MHLKNMQLPGARMIVQWFCLGLGDLVSFFLCSGTLQASSDLIRDHNSEIKIYHGNKSEV